jgi:four helix bundle protein
MKYKSFEEMPVWKKAMDLAQRIFLLTEKLPRKEDYGLTSQIRRSSLSVPSNIAEGFGRMHSKDKLQFYYDARGSVCETKNHLIYGTKVGYFSCNEANECMGLLDGIWAELNSLIKRLQQGGKQKQKVKV